MKLGRKLRILFVGPGLINIPPPGWGAVESVIWNLATALRKKGHAVSILNSRGKWAAFLSRPWEYDVVHLQFDNLATQWRKLTRLCGTPLLLTSHYGYLPQPNKWEEYYHPIFAAGLVADGVIALTQEIASVYQLRGYSGWLRSLRNCVEVNDISWCPSGNGKAICLGRIEPRKRQARLATWLSSNKTVKCDFYGDICDDLFVADGTYARFCGTWSRADVRAKLTEYSGLILFSDGEAHPLVTAEAMAAGLSVIVSPEAAAQLDISRPWVHCISQLDATTEKSIGQVLADNTKYRGAIRADATTRFSVEAVSTEYIELISEFCNVWKNPSPISRTFHHIFALLSHIFLLPKHNVDIQPRVGARSHRRFSWL